MSRAPKSIGWLCLAGCDAVFGTTPPTTVDVSPTAPCYLDEFEGDTLDARWVVSGTTPQLTIGQDGTLAFHAVAGASPSTYNSLIESEGRNFGNGWLMAELVDPPALHRETSLRLSRAALEYMSIGLRFAREQDTVPRLVAKQNEDAAPTIDRPFDPIRDRWFRILVEGTQVTFGTSPDGVDWEDETTLVNVRTEAMSVLVNGYITGDAQGSGTPSPDPEDHIRWDNLSIRTLDCPVR